MAMEIGAAAEPSTTTSECPGLPRSVGRSAEPPSFRLATIAEILCPHTIVVNRAGQRIGDESFFPSMCRRCASS